MASNDPATMRCTANPRRAPIWLAAVFMALVTISTARADAFNNGLSAYNVGDYAAAYSLWLPLARQGHANSQSAIAYLFYSGRGVRENKTEAAKWYALAARQGEPTAQSFLCKMHLHGDGVPRDLIAALMWCELSINNGETRGNHTRDDVMRQMTTAQRDAAWELVAHWSAHDTSRPRANSTTAP